MPEMTVDQQIIVTAPHQPKLRTVLFATDFSPACNNAWPWAQAFARRNQSKLLLVHVLAPSLYASVPAELLVEARERARVEAGSELNRLVRYGASNSEVLLREGNVADVLLGVIKGHRVDLLVTATHGHSHLKRLLLGSTAEKMFRQSSCPVLVVPERARFPENGTDWLWRIVCAIDFTPASFAALAYAASLARAHGAQLIVIHAIREARFIAGEHNARIRDKVEDRLRQVLPAEFDLPCPARFEVAFGPSDRAISRIAAQSQADLVVMGANPANATAAHQAERTTYRVIRWSHCPVLTIPLPSTPS